MGIDNLIRLIIVTSDGKTRDIVKNNKSPDEQDLFWACSGGGAATQPPFADLSPLIRTQVP